MTFKYKNVYVNYDSVAYIAIEPYQRFTYEDTNGNFNLVVYFLDDSFITLIENIPQEELNLIITKLENIIKPIEL